jgi:hypothetical protein
MGARTLPKRNARDLARLRIEPAEGAFVLRRVPDSSIRGRRHVVRVVARADVVILDVGGEERCEAKEKGKPEARNEREM